MTVTEHAFESQGAYSWGLTADPQHISQWRDRVASAVESLGGDADAVAVGRLGSSELLTNVCKHVEDRRCRLLVTRENGFVYVMVFDRSRQVPAVTFPGEDAETGRGLWLLLRMADDFGYTCASDGKWVWFRCPLTCAAGVGSA